MVVESSSSESAVSSDQWPRSADMFRATGWLPSGGGIQANWPPLSVPIPLDQAGTLQRFE